ncbi:hypothetical protein HYY70_03820 [Candidatus Woesearchaeota archaeon]|nr:hypothetical protein [Candidatus Woesearchaeota archaeon]
MNSAHHEDYRTLANRLGSALKIEVRPSQLEIFARQPGHHLVVSGLLEGDSTIEVWAKEITYYSVTVTLSYYGGSVTHETSVSGRNILEAQMDERVLSAFAKITDFAEQNRPRTGIPHSKIIDIRPTSLE